MKGKDKPGGAGTSPERLQPSGQRTQRKGPPARGPQGDGNSRLHVRSGRVGHKVAAAWPGLSEQDLGQGCGAAGRGGVSQGTRAEEGNRGRKPERKEAPVRRPPASGHRAARGEEQRPPSGPRTGLGAAARAGRREVGERQRERACAHAGRAACLNRGRRRSRLG